MSIVDVRNLSFSFAGNRSSIIENISFTVRKGDIVGILGPSGSGKSTLLRLIAGLEIPAGGSIAISGKPVVNDRTFVQPEHRGVGMVFQDYALFPHLTVKSNILFALHRFPRADRMKRLAEMLELVQMTGFENRYPHELSGGQQQRVALARALAPKPDLLLMDEPFSNLDADLKESIRRDLHGILKKAEMTCLFVTHDRRDVDSICDCSIAMSELQPVREPVAAV